MNRFLAIGCLIGSMLAMRVVIGDFYTKLAMRTPEKFQAATYRGLASRWNPITITLVARNMDAVMDIIPLIDESSQSLLVAAILKSARKQAQWHPFDPYAYEILGRSILISSMSGSEGSLSAAMVEYDRAQELAPTFVPLFNRRRALAVIMKDDAKVRRIIAEMNALEFWRKTGGDKS